MFDAKNLVRVAILYVSSSIFCMDKFPALTLAWERTHAAFAIFEKQRTIKYFALAQAQIQRLKMELCLVEKELDQKIKEIISHKIQNIDSALIVYNNNEFCDTVLKLSAELISKK